MPRLDDSMLLIEPFPISTGLETRLNLATLALFDEHAHAAGGVKREGALIFAVLTGSEFEPKFWQHHAEQHLGLSK